MVRKASWRRYYLSLEGQVGVSQMWKGISGNGNIRGQGMETREQGRCREWQEEQLAEERPGRPRVHLILLHGEP